jgi:hypothetical protein
MEDVSNCGDADIRYFIGQNRKLPLALLFPFSGDGNFITASLENLEGPVNYRGGARSSTNRESVCAFVPRAMNAEDFGNPLGPGCHSLRLSRLHLEACEHDQVKWLQEVTGIRGKPENSDIKSVINRR